MTNPERKSKQRATQDVEALRFRLAERDRELAALTEHSLRILDELAALKRQGAESPQANQRVAQLQEALADARQRVRSSSRAYLAPSDPGADRSFDVVLWGLAPEPEPELGKSLASLAGASITAMMGQCHRAESFGPAARRNVTVLETSCSRPAHFWNQAMASTQADVVVFVAGSATIRSDDARKLAHAAIASGVSLACPVVATKSERACGRVEHGVFEVRPQPCSESATSGTVQFASPEAFAIAREVFESVGLFDQDLATDLALAEWTLRAAAKSLRVVAVVEANCEAESLRNQEGAVEEADRLVVLARHRPHQLMTAALSSESLWQMDSDALGAAMRAAIQRLPRAGEMPAAVDLLAHQAQTMSSWKRIAPALRERVTTLCRELQIPVDDRVVDAALPPLVDRIGAAVGSLRQRLAGLESSQQSAAKLQQDLEQLAQHHQEVERQLKDGMLARSNTIDALRNELLERERAIASLRQEVGQKQGDAQHLVDRLVQQQEQIVDLKEQLDRSVAEQDSRREAAKELRTAEALLLALQAETVARRAADEGRLKEASEADAAKQSELEQQSRLLAVAERELEALRLRSAEAEEARRMLEEAKAATEASLDDQRQRVESLERRCAEMQAELERQRSQSAAYEQNKDQSVRAAERRIAATQAQAEVESVAAAERLRAAQARTEEAEAAAQAAAARALGLEARIRAADSRIAALEQELAAAEAMASQDRLLASARADVAEGRAKELEAMLAEAAAAHSRLEDELEERGARNAQLDRNNRDQARALETVRAELQGTREEAMRLRTEAHAAIARAEGSTTRAEETSRVLLERDTWICLLLEEVRQRRVLPRDLLPHEVEFLARNGKTTKP